MAKLIVVTDTEGHILVSVPGDPIETDGGTIQFEVPSIAKDRRIDVPGNGVGTNEIRYHELDLPEDLLGSSPKDLHTELERRIQSGPTATG